MKEHDSINERAGMERRRSNSVSLHIERLVINGVPLGAGQGAQLQLAVQRELARLLQRDSIGPALRGGAMAELAAPAIQISAPFRPAEVGRQIARSVHESLTGHL